MGRSAPRTSDTQEVYASPLVARSASPEMSALFSMRHRALTWRRIWLALAESQRELGLKISAKQISALRAGLSRIDLDSARTHEKKLRHDLMAHLHAYGDVAPSARGILHLGATSMDIVDNADLLIRRVALDMIRGRLLAVIDAMAAQAKRHRSLPCLGFTHYQPAQLTTVGKRISLWCWDFVRDLEDVHRLLSDLRFRGIRGATGTQASYLSLLGSEKKVRRLEELVAQKLRFKQVEPVTGQTYSRKVDAQVISTVAIIAAGVHKFANDMRLLANLKEMEEPFEKNQVGSSAMAYKRNPMLSERATGLARFVISLAQSGFQNAAEQWLERTLDDSSNKRLLIPESFLAADGMLQIVTHIASGFVVYPKVMRSRIESELPFIASEEILMAASSAGGDRQALHERIRVHANAAAARVKRDGLTNDLLDRLRADPMFHRVKFDAVMDPDRFVGLAPQQVDDFLKTVIAPLRKRFSGVRRPRTEISV